jgi:hypothetical protein
MHMGNIDKRNRLDEEVFSYRISKNNSVFIGFNGKEIKSVKGKEAEKLITKIQHAETDKEVQLALESPGTLNVEMKKIINNKKVQLLWQSSNCTLFFY